MLRVSTFNDLLQVLTVISEAERKRKLAEYERRKKAAEGSCDVL